MRAHPISRHWGHGLFASSDMMSLEATRHLWNARLDPRRRTYAVGSYTHLLDQWTVIYDQPIVLNRRQAAAAIAHAANWSSAAEGAGERRIAGSVMGPRLTSRASDT